MYSKIVIISAFVAICHAGLLVDDGHGHSHAVSSQSIIRHDQPTHQIAEHYATPVLQHAAPIIQHAAPIVQHSSPLIGHSGALLQQSSLIGQHSSPLIGHSGSLLQQSSLIGHSTPYVHSAPIVQHISPAIHASPIVQHVAPVAIGHAQHIEEHAPAKYEFSYSVEDPHTGDHKSQHESRDGDVVKGEYSLLQPDGSVRKVEYTADHHSGFNAIVHNSAPAVHAAPVAHAPVVHAAPILAHH